MVSEVTFTEHHSSLNAFGRIHTISPLITYTHTYYSLYETRGKNESHKIAFSLRCRTNTEQKKGKENNIFHNDCVDDAIISFSSLFIAFVFLVSISSRHQKQESIYLTQKQHRKINFTVKRQKQIYDPTKPTLLRVL